MKAHGKGPQLELCGKLPGNTQYVPLRHPHSAAATLSVSLHMIQITELYNTIMAILQECMKVSSYKELFNLKIKFCLKIYHVRWKRRKETTNLPNSHCGLRLTGGILTSQARWGETTFAVYLQSFSNLDQKHLLMWPMHQEELARKHWCEHLARKSHASCDGEEAWEEEQRDARSRHH